MAAVVNVNGRICPEREAMISVFDHGFLFGEGVYEVFRTYNRQPFLFDRHMQRLRMSAGMISLRVPLSDAQFLDKIRETTSAADFNGDAYIRLLLTRGVGELSYDPDACANPSWVIIVKEHVAPPQSVYEKGVTVSLVDIVRNHPGSVNPLIKSNNLLNNALAMQVACRRGAYEAVMRNYRGELAECTQSNLFLVTHGTVTTPPLDAGLLAGITRAFVIELARELGLRVEERALHDPDLFGADEAFLTSTTKEVVPITSVDDRRIGTGLPGSVTMRLLSALRSRAQELTRRDPVLSSPPTAKQ